MSDGKTIAVLTPCSMVPMGGAAFLGNEYRLPRTTKPELEVLVAKQLLSNLGLAESTVLSIESNPNDPPDVLFKYDGRTIGVELVEIMPRNRRLLDSQISGVRREILRHLSVGDHTRGRSVFFLCSASSSEGINLKGSEKLVAELLNRELPLLLGQSHKSLLVPPELAGWYDLIEVQSGNIGNHPQLRSDLDPLLQFSPSSTYYHFANDSPEVLDATVTRKMRHTYLGDTWLLIWSEDDVFGDHHEEMREEIRSHIKKMPSPFCRVYFLTYSSMGFNTTSGFVRQRIDEVVDIP